MSNELKAQQESYDAREINLELEVNASEETMLEQVRQQLQIFLLELEKPLNTSEECLEILAQSVTSGSFHDNLEAALKDENMQMICIRKTCCEHRSEVSRVIGQLKHHRQCLEKNRKAADEKTACDLRRNEEKMLAQRGFNVCPTTDEVIVCNFVEVINKLLAMSRLTRQEASTLRCRIGELLADSFNSAALVNNRTSQVLSESVQSTQFEQRHLLEQSGLRSRHLDNLQRYQERLKHSLENFNRRKVCKSQRPCKNSCVCCCANYTGTEQMYSVIAPYTGRDEELSQTIAETGQLTNKLTSQNSSAKMMLAQIDRYLHVVHTQILPIRRACKITALTVALAGVKCVD